MQRLQAERNDLMERNGKLGLEFRDLQTRNRRQEDFIFAIQAKFTQLETKNTELLEQ